MTTHETLQLPQEIDFLPASYHQAQERRRIKMWRGTIVGIALLLSLLGSAQQYYRHLELAATRDTLEQQVLDSFAQLQGGDAKRRQIDNLEAQANLVTLLRLRVAPTRLLSATVECLPEFVSLIEFRVERGRTSTASSKRSRTGRPKAAGSADEEKSAAQLDLEQLLSERSQTTLCVTLTGIAPDDLSVSHYLAALEATGLFDSVQPLYTDETEYRELPMRVFSVRLTVRRPGQDAKGSRAAAGPIADSGPYQPESSETPAANSTLQASRSTSRRGS